MTDYREIVNKIDLRQLMAPGLVISSDRPVMVNCYWHEDSHASLVVYSNHCHCYGCGKHLTTLEWIGFNEGMDLESSFIEVLKVANDKYVGMVTVPFHKEEKRPVSLTLTAPMDIRFAEYCHDNLKGKRKWYLDRGLTEVVINDELLGYYKNAFAIPVWRADGALLTMRYRRDDSITISGQKYWGVTGRNRTFIYNIKALTEEYITMNDRVVVVCEGELDCLRLWCEGICSVAFTNGVSAYRNIINNYRGKEVFILARRIVIAFDMDDAGKTSAKGLSEIIGERSVILEWDEKLGNDITELCLSKGIDYVRDLIGGVLK